MIYCVKTAAVGQVNRLQVGQVIVVVAINHLNLWKAKVGVCYICDYTIWLFNVTSLTSSSLRSLWIRFLGVILHAIFFIFQLLLQLLCFDKFVPIRFSALLATLYSENSSYIFNQLFKKFQKNFNFYLFYWKFVTTFLNTEKQFSVI